MRNSPRTRHRLAWALGLLLVSGPTGRGGAAQELLEGIAALVGSEIVLVSEVNQIAVPVEEKMRGSGRPESEILTMRAEVLDRLIESRLIGNVVRRLELSASEAEIDQAVDSIARETGLSLEQLERSVASHGLTVEEYRAKIKSEIERSKVLNSMVRARVRLDDADVRALYAERFGQQPAGGEEAHLRHLLVAFGVGVHRDRDTACVLAAEAATRIASGEASFEELARELSDADPERGGELGWIHMQDLAAWMVPVVSSLEVGELSEVVETRFGCNLLQLVERREFEPVRFEQVRPTLENALFRNRMEEEYTRWIDSLRQQTYIERKGMFRDTSALNPGSAKR